jgi:hypothetical protein
MGDLYVHVRMQRCCREQLARIDASRSRLPDGPGALLAPLGEEPIDEAMGKMPMGAAARPRTAEEAALHDVVQATCRKLCLQHAQEHGRQGDTTESRFWARLAETF